MARRSDTKGKGSSKLVKSARRNVRIQTAPQRNAVDRAELQSGQDYLRALQAARSSYGGFQKELRQTPDFPLGQLTNQLQGQLSQFHTMLGGSPSPVPEGIPSEGMPVGLPGSEQGAGTALYSQLGDNAFNTLTNTASRDEMYQRSAAREGGLAERYARENLIQDLQDQLQGFDQRRMEIADLQGPMIQQEMERLRQEHQDDASNRALMQYLMGTINNDLQGGGRPGGGPGGRRITNPRGPGGQTGGHGLGDTAAGGNAFTQPLPFDYGYPPPTDTSVGGNEFEPPIAYDESGSPSYTRPGAGTVLAGGAAPGNPYPAYTAPWFQYNEDWLRGLV